MLKNHIAYLLLATVVETALAAEPTSDKAYTQRAPELEEIIVWGRAERQKGQSRSASEGLVGHADFSTRPLMRVGELVEVVPGMVATQHSGDGKANQYYLRGMNLDHGTDFSVYFEGMPINLRSHAHGQGYLDLNFLIPEIISTVEYQKGPYFAERGDFSTAGSSSITLYDEMTPFVEVSLGSDDYRRLVSAGTSNVRDGNLLLAAEVLRNDGPWITAADVEKNNFIGKYSTHHNQTSQQLIFAYYENDWQATDQVPRRLVNAGTIDRFGGVDPTVGGASRRLSLIGNIQADKWSMGGYFTDYRLNLFGNFTYFLEDPVNGDQHEQVDRRAVYGGHAQRQYAYTTHWTLRLGGDVRYDDVKRLDLYQTTARVRRKATKEDQVEWLSLGSFAEVEFKPTDNLRVTTGLRVDFYDVKVDSELAANGGKDRETHLIPNLNLAYDANEYVELYANWGRGFHSNDARGVTIEIDPKSGAAADPVGLLVDQQGAEVGVRLEGWQGLNTTLTYFWLESDSELQFLGDTGTTEAGAGSERTGVELNLFWILNEQWTFDLLASVVDSKFIDVPSNANAIPNAPGRVIGTGLTYVGNRLQASARLRYFGDTPLAEDGSVEQGDTSVINVRVAYNIGDWIFSAEVINVFDAEDNDSAYFYESALQGASGIEDVHFHPVEPLSVRFSVRWQI